MSGSTDNGQGLLAERKAVFWETTDYDRAFRGTFGAYMTGIEAAALERLLGKTQVETLLDLGCGHGRFLRFFAPRARRLVGLDRSARLLEVARDGLAAKPAAAPVRLVWGSAQDLPFADGSVDAITCVRVVQHLPDQDKALGEMKRVLKPGGALILVQYNVLSLHGAIRALKLPVKWALRRAIRATGREPRFDEPTRWTTFGALAEQLGRAGLQIERTTGAWLFPLQYFRFRASNDAWPLFHGLAWAIEKLADVAPFAHLGGYVAVRCTVAGSSARPS